MKTTQKQNLLATALACALAATTAHAQTESPLHRPLTFAPADAISSGGGGAGVDEATHQAELVKKSLSSGPEWGLCFAVTFLFPK